MAALFPLAQLPEAAQAIPGKEEGQKGADGLFALHILLPGGSISREKASGPKSMP